MVGGNPYQAWQQAGNDGIGAKVRGAHGNDAIGAELGPTENATTTWAESQQQVHQETGGEVKPMRDVRRDLMQ